MGGGGSAPSILFVAADFSTKFLDEKLNYYGGNIEVIFIMYTPPPNALGFSRFWRIVYLQKPIDEFTTPSVLQDGQ